MFNNGRGNGECQVETDIDSQIKEAVSNVFEPRSWEIAVSATRQEEEPKRLIRLHRVIGFAHAISMHYGNQRLLSKVLAMHDHKGDLTVRWRSAPAPGEMEIFNLAWCDGTVGDGWGAIQHINSVGQEMANCRGPAFDFSDLFSPLHHARAVSADDSLVA